MCYNENVVENIEEKKNAFTKKMNKVGQLADRKRVMVFADTDNAIDCKTHFPFIVAKTDFGAENFIKAVRDALEEQSKHPNGEATTKAKRTTKKSKTTEDTLEEHVSVTEDEAEELRDMGAVFLNDEDDKDNYRGQEVRSMIKNIDKSVLYDFELVKDDIKRAITITELYSKQNYTDTEALFHEILDVYTHDADVIFDFFTHDNHEYRLSNLDGAVVLDVLK